MLGLEPATYNSIGLIVLTAALSFMAAKYWNSKANKKAALAEVKKTDDERDAKIQDLQNQLSVLTATFTPISAAFQAVLIKQLTHFHTPEMDALLIKAEKNGLSNSEAERLRDMLLERSQDLNGKIDDSEREAALMLPYVMNRVRAGAAVSDSEVMVVLVPKDKPK